MILGLVGYVLLNAVAFVLRTGFFILPYFSIDNARVIYTKKV